jgi:hypothetical protein
MPAYLPFTGVSALLISPYVPMKIPVKAPPVTFSDPSGLIEGYTFFWVATSTDTERR